MMAAAMAFGSTRIRALRAKLESGEPKEERAKVTSSLPYMFLCPGLRPLACSPLAAPLPSSFTYLLLVLHMPWSAVALIILVGVAPAVGMDGPGARCSPE